MNFRRRLYGETVAFSMVELLVGLVLVGGLVIAMVALFTINHDQAELNRATQELLSRQQMIQQRLQSDLHAAVKVSGTSQERWPGISRAHPDTQALLGPRDDPNDNDSLMIIRPAYSEHQLPIEDASLAGSGDSIEITLAKDIHEDFTGPQRDHYYNMERLVRKALEVHPFAVVTNQSYTNVFELKDLSAGEPGSEDEDLQLKVEGASSVFDEIIEGSSITPALAVHWYVDHRGHLIRKVPEFGDRAAEVIDFGLVENFQMDFTFGDSARDDVILKSSTQGYSHPHDPELLMTGVAFEFDDYTVVGSCSESGAEPECCPHVGHPLCVGYEDIASTRVAVAPAKNLKLGGGGLSMPSQLALRYDGDKLRLNSVISTDPGNFSLGGSLKGVGGHFEHECADIENRCNPRCESYFVNDTDPNDERWSGYGRHVGTGDPSAYCLCAQGTTESHSRIVPEIASQRNTLAAWRGRSSASGDHSLPLSDPDNARLNACVAHFGPGHEWAELHPIVRVLHRCFGQDFSREIVSERDPDTHERSLNLSALQDFITDWYSDGATWRAKLTCGQSHSYCDQYIRRLFYTSDSTMPVPAGREMPDLSYASPYFEGCACARSSRGIRTARCNHGRAASGRVCENTWSGDVVDSSDEDRTKVYRVRVDTSDFPHFPSAEERNEHLAAYADMSPEDAEAFAEGLTLDEAIACQCYAEQYHSREIPQGSRRDYSSRADFRVAGGASEEPVPPSSYEGRTIYPSLTARTVEVAYELSPSVQRTRVVSCGDVLAYDEGVVACTRSSKTFAARGRAADYEDLPATYRDSGSIDYSSYCYSGCGTGSVATDEALGITDVRLAITGASSVGDLPVSCGGTAMQGRVSLGGGSR